MLLPGGDIELYWETYEDLCKNYFAGIWAEWNCQLLIASNWYANHFWLKPEVGWLEDFDSLKGYRIRSYTPEMAKLVEMLGGTPQNIEWAEVYTSLQTGLIDGLMTGIPAGYRNGFFEQIDKMSMIYAMPSLTCPYVVNKDAWSELPDDLKDIVTNYFESKQEWVKMGPFMEEGTYIQLAMINYNVQFHPLESSFREEIRAKSYEWLWKPWIDRAGPQGEEAFNELATILVAKGYDVPGYTPY